MFYAWLVIIIALAIIEMATVSLVSIWFVLSGLLAMISTLFTNNVTIQIAIFIVFGFAFMLLTKRVVGIDSFKKVLNEMINKKKAKKDK